MAETPAVSVVIASYNRAALLRETLDSVLQQRFADYEVIVVDDGSSDDTAAAVRAYGDRVRYYYQENRGPSAARNLGARHALGGWISIQDSDDLCATNHLETLYGYARQHPECGMVFANGAYLGGPEHQRHTIIPPAKSKRLAERGIRLYDLFDKSIVRLQAALIAKSCYDAVHGHDEELRISMDLDLSFRLLQRYPLAYLDEVVFYYRKHPGNTGANQELRLRENIRVIEKLLHENPQAEALLGRGRVAARLAYRYYRLAKVYRRAGRRSQAREALKQAAALRPMAMKYRFYQLRWCVTG
jgi:glycosyltransferase involved in cell wall biosynthesis